jgi:hypothetical protein
MREVSRFFHLHDVVITCTRAAPGHGELGYELLAESFRAGEVADFRIDFGGTTAGHFLAALGRSPTKRLWIGQAASPSSWKTF